MRGGGGKGEGKESERTECREGKGGVVVVVRRRKAYGKSERLDVRKVFENELSRKP